MDQTFSQFAEDINSGKQLLCEGALPIKLVASLIRQATYQVQLGNNGMVNIACNPGIDTVASALGIDYQENLVDNKELLATYEKVCAAYNKAKTEYLVALNRELKTIK